MSNAPDLAGQRFGWLTVVRRAGSDRHGKTLWLCQCGCGEQKLVARQHLQTGHVKSCGCKNRMMKATIGRTRREGGVLTRKGAFVSSDDIPEAW